MGYFPDELHCDLLSVPFKDKPILLTADFSYVSDAGETITAESGFRSNGASVPRFFWRIIPPLGNYTYASVIHDWMCDEKIGSAKYAAELFLEMMKLKGVPGIKCRAMYRAVLWFGPKF